MAVDAKLGRAAVEVRATLDKLSGDLSQARSKTDSTIAGIVKGAGKNFQMLGTVAMAGITAATGAIAGLGAALAKVTIDAAPAQAIKDAFEGIATASGESADEMLVALQRGSSGMISQRDLMLSYNSAAQLVSTTFANQLPDAMQYLSKVSASTGQDMGFMLSSLVRGVGRLSPLILDNLGIQVSLEEATARAAEMFGVEADALDKGQVQAAMMNVVLEKLAANTAAMPDVADSAAAGIARMKARFQDIKDTVGMALLPVLNSLMQTLGSVLDRILPPLVAFLENSVVPALSKVANVVGLFVTALEDGQSPIQALQSALAVGGFQGLADAIGTVRDVVTDLWTKIEPVVSSVIAWIGENVKLQDVLIVLGAAIASVVLPAIWSVITAVAPVIAVFIAAVAAVAALRSAWENDFMGIRTALTDAWEGTILPALQSLWEWLQINVPIAIQTLSDFWTNTLLPAIQAAWGFFLESVVPAFIQIATTAQEVVGAAITVLATIWETILQPALELVWGFIQDSVIPLFEALADTADAVLGLALTALAGLWENVLQPALETVWSFIQDSVLPIFEEVAGFIEDTVSPVIEALAGTVLDNLKSGLDSVKTAVGWVIGKLHELASAIRNVKLPPWLTPGSPTPFELGLRGIASALTDVKVAGEAAFSPLVSQAQADSGMWNDNRSFTVEMHGMEPASVLPATQSMRALWGM